MPIEARLAFARARSEALDDRAPVGGQLDERAGRAPARPDAAVRSRAAGRRVTVPVTRPAHRRVVAVRRRRTARHACAARPEVTTLPAPVRALSQPISDQRTHVSVLLFNFTRLSVTTEMGASYGRLTCGWLDVVVARKADLNWKL